MKFVAPPLHPDYHSNQPGRALAGRALAPLPFDGRLLGKDFDRVRPPIAPFMVLGGMMVGKLDIPYLLKPFGSVANFKAATKLLLRHATDRLRYKRGTRLVMGNALVGRLFYSLRQRAVPIEYDARLAELVKSNGRVEGAVVDIGNKRETVRARRAVILATGGFGADKDCRRNTTRMRRSSTRPPSQGRAATASRPERRPVARSRGLHDGIRPISRARSTARPISRTSCSTAPSPV